MLDDLRRAAVYLEELPDQDARQRAIRLWSAAQAVERMMVAIEQVIVAERSRRTWDGNGNAS